MLDRSITRSETESKAVLKDWMRFEDRLDKLRKNGCLIESEPYAEVVVLQKPYDWEEKDIHDQDAL